MRAWLRTEDGLALLIGLTLTILGALPLVGVDTFGWVVKTNAVVGHHHSHVACLQDLCCLTRDRISSNDIPLPPDGATAGSMGGPS